MRCPVDNETLVMADRGGVEIDYCPKCRGVWLDRGELDKIIDRAAGVDGASAPRAAAPAQAQPPVYQQQPPVYQPVHQPVHQQAPAEPRTRRHDDDDDDDYRYKKKRRESFLGDIFDF